MDIRSSREHALPPYGTIPISGIPRYYIILSPICQYIVIHNPCYHKPYFTKIISKLRVFSSHISNNIDNIIVLCYDIDILVITAMTSPHHEILNQIGLSDKESSLYDTLLKHGSGTVGELLKITTFKRGDLYNILYSLRDRGLIVESLKRGISYFQLEHPQKLRDVVTQAVDRGIVAQRSLETVLPDLISQFNLTSERPGVRFFEGREGIIAVSEDNLTTKNEILTFGDIDSIVKYIPDINEEYAKKRNRLGIKKRGISIDTPLARKILGDYHRTTTETKLIKAEMLPPFQTVMQIYDNKISYITLSDKKMIGVIIDDAHIAAMHRYIFETLWRSIPGFVVERDQASA